MADRALRGMQIGAKSLESEDGVVFADRFIVRYACPNGHEFEVTLSSEATAPATWECKCGQAAELIGETVEARVTDDETIGENDAVLRLE